MGLLCGRDELRQASETPLKRCTTAKFSNGGSRLAVSAGRTITIFNALAMRVESTLHVRLPCLDCVDAADHVPKLMISPAATCAWKVLLASRHKTPALNP